jgi:hypothetical protein
MGQRPNELTPHESPQHYWGAELRELRTTRGMSLAELGEQLHFNPSYLAKIERAERSIPAELAADCDRVLDAGGALIRLHALVESTRDRAAKAGGQRCDQVFHVAGGSVDVASRTGTLAGKTTLPAPADTGAELVVPARTAEGRVIFVSVPRRIFLQAIGSTAVGAAAASFPPFKQHTALLSLVNDVNPIEHFRQMLQALIDNDNLFGARRVIPMVSEQITIMQHLRSEWRGTDCRELFRMQAKYTEFCGWLHQDAGEHRLAEFWTDRALGLAQLAADHDLVTYVLARKAGLAGDMNIFADAVGAGEQAFSMAPPHSRLAVLAATFAGHGYALSGDYTAAKRTYDGARELFDTLDTSPDSVCPSLVDENYIALQWARSMTVLGDHHFAARIFHDVLAKLPGGYPRDRGVYLARAALAHAGDREVEHAATLGLAALAIGTETGSARILTELARLNDRLVPWDTVPAVADFRTAMQDTTVRET